MKRISVGNKLFMFENIYYVFLYVVIGIILVLTAAVAFVTSKTGGEDEVAHRNMFTGGINLIYNLMIK